LPACGEHRAARVGKGAAGQKRFGVGGKRVVERVNREEARPERGPLGMANRPFRVARNVGTGPVRIRGTGDLVFAFNDDWFPDNTGSFTVTVTYAHGAATQASEPCTPGNGYGDANHEHTGPPGQTDDTCRPGWGYGDTNHEHAGPPGQNKDAGGGNNGKPHR